MTQMNQIQVGDVAYELQDASLTTRVAAIESSYITKAANDLENYYKKSDVYTQAEVNGLISAIPKFAISVVDALPSSGISTSTIYLLKTSTTETGNLYTEYIYVDNKWETLGTQTLDLSGYALKATTLAGYGITDAATSAQGAKADTAVQSITLGGVAQGKADGVVSLPAYPTTLPASDVKAWAKANEKPSYTASEVGAYAKPSGGIPKTDLASAVQTSLSRADSAVQPAALGTQVTYTLNGTTLYINTK